MDEYNIYANRAKILVHLYCALTLPYILHVRVSFMCVCAMHNWGPRSLAKWCALHSIQWKSHAYDRQRDRSLWDVLECLNHIYVVFHWSVCLIYAFVIEYPFTPSFSAKCSYRVKPSRLLFILLSLRWNLLNKIRLPF